MNPDTEIPTFAVVGHPNEGKSSVVATLSEDDAIRISDFPGETTVCSDYSVRVDDRILIRFLDTPGFQYPRETLEWMQQHPAADQHPARAFVDAFKKEAHRHHDVELMIPMAAGAGIIYVVDGSRPMRQNDLCEMEILRMMGNPRMALINPKDGEETFLQAWKDACAKSFNLTRTFNAHRASFSERMALFESLKRIHQDWEPAMVKAVEAFECDWKHRNRQAAQSISACLVQALELRTEARTEDRNGEETTRLELVQSYQDAVADLEKGVQSVLRRLYRHRAFQPSFSRQSVLREDLFTERTWRLLGLSRKQIIIAAAILGGGAGFKLDLLFANLSFGFFTLSTAALAAAGTWLRGEHMARVTVKRLRMGGVILSVGPNRNPQFPFVLLDRLLLYYELVINWAHARQDAPQARVQVEDEEKAGFSARWKRARRDRFARLFKRLRSGKETTRQEALQELQAELEALLWERSHGRDEPFEVS
ncbi:GTPase domain-containing protein [Verrucomicrobia bacterium]|nr:GTPase domain-containing protein [Verrucomicrobiota bacterium]